MPTPEKISNAPLVQQTHGIIGVDLHGWMLGRGSLLIVTTAIAARIYLAKMVRVTVTMTLIVQACLCVELTTVKVDREAWTVVHLPAVMTLIA